MVLAGVKNTVKMELFPLKKNNFLLRLENLRDVFDSDAKTTDNVNLDILVKGLLISTNPKDYKDLDYNIIEKSLTANMDKNEMQERKIKWKTVDDVEGEVCKPFQVVKDYLVTLRP